MDARREGTEDLGREPTDAPTDAPNEREAPVWRCARCHTVVSSPNAVITVAGRPACGRYTNPAGVVWEVVTVGTTRNVRIEGTPTPAFSWFPGYHWRFARCEGCGEHLGWHYTAVGAPIAPPTFWGLIRQRLV